MADAVDLRIRSPWLDQVPVATAGILLVAAMVFGGDAKGKGDALVHAVAVLALGVALLHWPTRPLSSVQRATLWILLGGLALGALQLVPLPVAVFAQLPHRAQVLEELRSAGLDPQWMSLTLDRWGTVRAMLALLTFLAMWMLCTTMSSRARARLLTLAVAIAVPMALLGFAQASFKLDTTGANGLFENRNHYATLMAMLVPFAFAAARHARETSHPALAMLWYAAVVAMLLAASLSFSRVGSVLALVSSIAALSVLGGGKTPGYASRGGALLSLAIAIGGAVFFASDRLGQRFQSDMLVDLRWQYVEISWEVLKAYFPWGSGFGSFRAVYAQFEPLQSVGEFTYANHAHNEMLQNAIEGGLPALALMAAFLGVVAIAGGRAVAQGLAGDYWRRAALISVCAPVLHSLVDYPLRTLSCATVLALALAVLVSNGPGRRSHGAGKRPQSPDQLR